VRETATAVVVVDPAAPDAAALARAAAVLRAGGLVAFPTETFYGLGAAAGDPAAARRVCAVKGRSESKPLLVLVDSIAMAESLAADVTPRARELMNRHWPGPLTLVLRARLDLPRVLTAGTGTIGMRMSRHPVARGLVRALGAPVTAPSANPEGGAPPTTAAQVLKAFDGMIDLVIDGGPTAGGPASTVVDVTTDAELVLRAGVVTL
jgi:L-threonylcarbamoyladenylate synthase